MLVLMMKRTGLGGAGELIGQPVEILIPAAAREGQSVARVRTMRRWTW